MRVFKLKKPTPALIVVYAVALSTGAAANIRINFIAKGSAWDFYPAAEILWVLCSVAILAMCGSMKHLAIAVIALLFLDSFVDVCAMGQRFWWAGPHLLVEWKWDWLSEHRALHKYVYAYWIVTWGMQVPLRCLAMARAVSGRWGRRFFIIAVGLNLIWFTAPQDVLYYFVWLGLYNAQLAYFSYLPPEGFWNLWNMLLLRVPIGVGVGALIIRGGNREGKISRVTTALVACAVLAIGFYAAMFLFIALHAAAQN
jgi:hypothetical protein